MIELGADHLVRPGIMTRFTSMARLSMHWRERISADATEALIKCLCLIAGGMLTTILVQFAISQIAEMGHPNRAFIHISQATQKRRHDIPTSQSQALPKVEPLVFTEINTETARNLNASVPFAALGLDRPLPFQLGIGSAGFSRALDCLASAILYEAGDNDAGQTAVAQVVLNRMHHPAFPHSVCGVVYQGSERVTGCQFTFTCDGALHRAPSAAAWQRAKAVAASFLSGRTDPAVGMATHYHTDWVHPYWSQSLDKIARVDTHLFFRWHGSWGRKATFTAAYAGAEPWERKLAFISPAHRNRSIAPIINTSDASAMELVENQHMRPSTVDVQEGDHFILVDAGGDGSGLALLGLDQCRSQDYCKVVGWDRRSQNYGSPRNPIIQSVAFLYVRDRRTGVEVVLWDCARFNRTFETQCLSDKNRRWISFRGDMSYAS